MRIIYPYNEILPKKRAHDVFIINECASLAKQGCTVSLLCGKGSDEARVFEHYQIAKPKSLHIEPHFIVRKNNPFNLSWNLPFFLSCQQTIRQQKPSFVFLSVRKQGAYHLARKIPNTRYLYEVHELSWYPNHTSFNEQEFKQEKEMLSHADIITVTTRALKKILENPPYSLNIPIEVVPLGVRAKPLPPPPPKTDPLILMYVGQLYGGQGLSFLLSAMSKVKNVQLKIIGGTQREIVDLTILAKKLGAERSVEFLGFIPPSQLEEVVKEAHGFIAPFENKGRMPYVAHTKLFEYAQWGRPILAPDLPIVKEHFEKERGVLLFEPNNSASLITCIHALKRPEYLQTLQTQIKKLSGHFTWEKRAQQYLNYLL